MEDSSRIFWLNIVLIRNLLCLIFKKKLILNFLSNFFCVKFIVAFKFKTFTTNTLFKVFPSPTDWIFIVCLFNIINMNNILFSDN